MYTDRIGSDRVGSVLQEHNLLPNTSCHLEETRSAGEFIRHLTGECRDLKLEAGKDTEDVKHHGHSLLSYYFLSYASPTSFVKSSPWSTL